MDISIFSHPTFIAISALLGFLIFNGWSRAKSDTSIFKGAKSPEDVVTALISTIGGGRASHGLNGHTELRPPFGYRVLAPLFGLGLVLLVDWDTILHDIGLTNETHQLYAKLAFAAAMVFALFELNFRQRVVYDRHEISSLCATLTMQSRRLDGLVEIGHHPKQNILIFSFADQPDLNVPKFIANRDEFLAEMEAIAAANRAREAGVSRA